MAMLETPSRIWRRIQEEEDNDMPSLPSLPAFEDSADIHRSTTSDESRDQTEDLSAPLQSTPAALSTHTTTSTLRLQSSASSTARFAQSLASRASRSASAFSSSNSLKRSPSPANHQSLSFDDVSAIPSLPGTRPAIDEDMDLSDEGHEDDDLSLADALRSLSRASSPELDHEPHQKSYDYSVSLKSEPKASPFDKMRNVSVRRPMPRMRTPSLTRTTPSPSSSSSSNSTPHSPHSFAPTQSPLNALSVPLPPSNNASPAQATSPKDTSTIQDPPLEAYSNEQEAPEDIAGDSATSEREPTFSSEEAPTPRSHPVSLASARSPSIPPSNFSSPAASVAFTPTPAFAPRPRARFLPTTPSPEIDDPSTPYARRRSFLMDVINSTARPRLAQPTPHPVRAAPMETPSSGGSSERAAEFPTQGETPSSSGGSNEQDTAPLRLQAAFAGLTPGPRPTVRTAGRLSHPLATAWTAPSESESDAGSQSPYERASFVSTASSHDLTAHPRANASFDPLVGLGAGGHGVGRFNAGKLNAYLHGLNRRLQEESETLAGAVGVLRRENVELAGQNAALREEMEGLQAQMRGLGGRRHSGGRRVSDIGVTLGDVAEDAGGEGWMEEKAEMEEELDALRAELERCVREKEDAASTLDAIQAERSRDKARWREKMAEVERGVAVIIQDLEAKLKDAETKAEGVDERGAHVKELERAVQEIEREKDYANQRAEKAEKMLENDRELGGDLREANEKLGQTMAELRNAQTHIQDLEDELHRAEERMSRSDNDLHAEQEQSRKLAEELDTRDARLADLEDQLDAREKAASQTELEFQDARAYIAELETDAGAAGEHIDALEDEVRSLHAKLAAVAADEEQFDLDFAKLQEEADRNAELARQLEEAIEAAEEKIRGDEATIAELRRTVSSLERERDRSRGEPSRNQDEVLDEAHEQIQALEDELDDANREIGRLNGMLAQSPARKAIDKAREAKVEILEKEKEELLQRVQMLKGAMVGMSTPGKAGGSSGISPFHRQVLNMTMKTPKTPGGPLKDLSWLHPSMADASTSPYLAEIQRLQQELDRANESIDEKLDRLESAGFGVVELTQQLDDERARNGAVEEELARLERREGRRLRRLEKARCLKCRSKVDLRGLNRAADGDESSLDISSVSWTSEPPTPPTRTSETLKAELQAVNKELTVMKKQWLQEKRQLLGDKAALQDAANRLNLQIQDTEERAAQLERAGQKVKSSIQDELEQARGTIADLEDALKAERSRLRSLTTAQSKAERDRDDILVQLKRTESDMDDVKQQLQRIKRDNSELESELRSNATAEQKARLLEVKSAQNAETIEQLRQERSLLVADHKKLQQRFREASENMSKLRDEHAAEQTTHDKRRHALDAQMLEIAELKRTLAERTDALHATEAAQIRASAGLQREREQERIVTALEADLARVRRNAEALGRDLKAERSRREDAVVARREAEERRKEVERLERARKQAGAEVRVLRERVELLEGERRSAQTDEEQLAALRVQHKLESKGLIVQIHYLKAKFSRESTLRTDLGYQKRYLLVLLGRYERSEEKVLASIARIGFQVPGPPPQRRHKTLRSVALGVVFLQRVRRASEHWRGQRASKPAVRAALEDVRRRRKTVAS